MLHKRVDCGVGVGIVQSVGVSVARKGGVAG